MIQIYNAQVISNKVIILIIDAHINVIKIVFLKGTCFELEISKYCSNGQWLPISFSIASEQTFLTTKDVNEEADVRTFRKSKGSIL